MLRSHSSVSYVPEISDLFATGKAERALHEKAAATAQAGFGNKVFVRGVIELSNFCRQNCSYCGMRRENRALDRYRASLDTVAELLLHHRPSSITDINIQTGEDPVAVREIVLPLVKLLKNETPLGISVCLGSLPKKMYDELQQAGASIYILKFETGDPDRYLQLQSPGNLPDRIANINYLASKGWSVSSGFIAGLPGVPAEELLGNFQLATSLPIDGCSVSPFVPGDETPLSSEPTASIELTLNCMAALRLMRPDWVIPAVSALNLAEPGAGYRRGLRTGANLVTINLTPAEYREDYLLYKRARFIMTEEIILKAMHAEGLEPSSTGLAVYYRTRKNHLAVV
jgi:biotin synthase